MNEILTIFWFFLPAGLANTSATLSTSIPGLKRLKQPIDFGLSWRGKRIFGDHKTFRGLVFASFIAGLSALLQAFLIRESSLLEKQLTIDYLKYSYEVTASLGALQGFSALTGDALKSFFKRRVGIAPGGKWFPFDQIDFLIAATLAMLPLVQFTWYAYLALFIGFVSLHRLSSIIAYYLGLKDVPH